MTEQERWDAISHANAMIRHARTRGDRAWFLAEARKRAVMADLYQHTPGETGLCDRAIAWTIR